MSKKHEHEDPAPAISNASPDLADALRSIEAVGEDSHGAADTTPVGENSEGSEDTAGDER